MTNRARAVVFDGPGTPLQFRNFDLPQVRAGEVLVRITTATVCGSDLHTFQGKRSTPCPTILGHEIIGRVAELPSGESVSDIHGNPLKTGDRVTWSVAARCGECFFCTHGLPQKCEHLFKYGHERITENHQLSGGVAEYCHLVKGTAILRVPDELPDKVACPANCATATVAAAMRYGGDCKDGVVLVQGAGMLGLTNAAMARSRGAREVIVCDVSPQRLEMAEQFGATETVLIQKDATPLSGAVSRLTSGRGVDLALDMSGSPDAMEMGISLLRIGGRYVWVGAVFPQRPLSINAETIVRKLIQIQGIHNYAPEDLAAALDFLQACQNQFPFEGLVDTTFPLDKADTAFAYAIESGALRVAIQP